MDGLGAVLRRAVDDGLTPSAVAGAIVGGGDRVVVTAGSARRDTVFDIASLTKVVGTTTALMVLTDRGELDPDDPLDRFLTGFDPGITLRHLLTHRAGLLPWQPLYRALPTDRRTTADVVDLIASSPTAGTVGSARRYSDLGMMLLGAVVERVTGSTLDAAVAVLVTEPLGLTATGYRPPGTNPDPTTAATSLGDAIEERMVATGIPYPVVVEDIGVHRPRRHRLQGEVNDGNAFHALGGVAGHAGLFSAVDDLLTFGSSLCGAGPSPASGATVARFFAPGPGDQALGWWTRGFGGRIAHWHSGFTGTRILVQPATGSVVVLLTSRLAADHPDPPDVGPLWADVLAAAR